MGTDRMGTDRMGTDRMGTDRMGIDRMGTLRRWEERGTVSKFDTNSAGTSSCADKGRVNYLVIWFVS